MGRIHVLYSFGLVEMEILDFQILFSRFSMATRVITLHYITLHGIFLMWPN